jgi:glycosyltransferase involved in cell wall biosynthesis
MTANGEYKTLFLGAGEQMQCGVGQFTRLLREAVEKLDPGRSIALTLTRSEGGIGDIWRAVGSAQAVVCNFPIVAWKRVVVRPLLALLIARLRRRHVLLVQHEWASLHWLRRLTYLPALLFADKIIMFSPLVRRELANDPLVGWSAAKSVLAPLPPNIAAPRETSSSPLRRQLAEARSSGRMVIGHFGSIYPGKQPSALLDIVAILWESGRRPFAVYIGSFIKAFDNVEQEFDARVNELGLADDVIVSGYIESDAEVFGLFEEIDAFCYPLEEGLTARRASILTSAQSSKPVIVTGPANADEFDHHPRFKALIARGAIGLVPPGSPPQAYADRIMQAIDAPPAPAPFDFEGWWRDVAQSISAQL